jgi:hypothetical protein
MAGQFLSDLHDVFDAVRCRRGLPRPHQPAALVRQLLRSKGTMGGCFEEKLLLDVCFFFPTQFFIFFRSFIIIIFIIIIIINAIISLLATRLSLCRSLTAKVYVETELIKPIQRLPRYCLLLDDLWKHTTIAHPDNENLGLALEKVVR